MGFTTLQIAFAVIFAMVTAYSAGRVHQWHKHSFERDVAYREGYEQAARTLFHLTVRNPPGKPAAAGRSSSHRAVRKADHS
jgi:hypothetical protein